MDSNIFEKKELNNKEQSSVEKKDYSDSSLIEGESAEAEIVKAQDALLDEFPEDKKELKDLKEEKNNPIVEKKLEEYIVRAFSEGSEKIINEIAKTNDPYLIDAFHDKLLEEVKKRNFIK